LCITKNNEFKKVIDVYDVNGVYDRDKGNNLEEANEVVKILQELIPVHKTAIVITFNIKQADLIQTKCLSIPQLGEKIENLTIKIRSLENVQGDEANLVIISTTFAKDKTGKFVQNFGPINQDGGKNRINVMVSRAKERMVVVKSINASDITNIHNENTIIFKNFMGYVEQLQLDSQTPFKVSHSDNNDITNSNQIIEDIIHELQANSSYVIQQNKQIGSHFIDIAIYKGNSSKISLCILLDNYHQ
jgi:hypothetical protein